MSNTNTVPSERELLKKGWDKKYPTQKSGYEGSLFIANEEFVVSAMREHTRLHLEAMRDEIADKLLDYHFIDGTPFFNKQSVIEAANTYIKNNKL